MRMWGWTEGGGAASCCADSTSTATLNGGRSGDSLRIGSSHVSGACSTCTESRTGSACMHAPP